MPGFGQGKDAETEVPSDEAGNLAYSAKIQKLPEDVARKNKVLGDQMGHNSFAEQLESHKAKEDVQGGGKEGGNMPGGCKGLFG